MSEYEYSTMTVDDILKKTLEAFTSDNGHPDTSIVAYIRKDPTDNKFLGMIADIQFILVAIHIFVLVLHLTFHTPMLFQKHLTLQNVLPKNIPKNKQ